MSFILPLPGSRTPSTDIHFNCSYLHSPWLHLWHPGLFCFYRTLNGEKEHRWVPVPVCVWGRWTEGAAEGIHPLGRSFKEFAGSPRSLGKQKPSVISAPAYLGFRGWQLLERCSKCKGETNTLQTWGGRYLGREFRGASDQGNRNCLLCTLVTFSVVLQKSLTQSSLRKAGFAVAHSPRVRSIRVGKVWRQDHEVAAMCVTER